MKHLNFVTWLLIQKYEDSPELDLQQDTKSVLRYYKCEVKTYQDLKFLMLGKNACYEAMRTLNEVHIQYKKYIHNGL
jgi:hypothetical protein